jgi:3-hydroxybutyryl-CoA dehydrogenase
MKDIKKVTVAGAGTLGSQIAWQTAFMGFEVCVYDAFEKGLERGKQFHQEYARLFRATRGVSQADIDQTINRLTYTTDLAKAVEDADLVSESVPESLEVKKAFYWSLAKHAPAKTIFTTNTSTLLPSQFAMDTGRPERFLALHFANRIWYNNIGEVMGHPGTDPAIFDQVIAFAKEIGMVPIPIHKEQHGYVLNSLLVPFLSAAGDLLVQEIAEPEYIDKAWMIGMGTKIGPCSLMDVIGLETIYNVEKMWGEKLDDPATLARAAYYKEHFVDKGKLGIKTGEGFYKYPKPAYRDPDFLTS